jgi:hypothetical protein
MGVKSTKIGHHASHLGATDPSAYMLGLPESHPRLGRWLVLTIVAGTILALAVFALENEIFGD